MFITEAIFFQISYPASKWFRGRTLRCQFIATKTIFIASKLLAQEHGNSTGPFQLSNGVNGEKGAKLCYCVLPRVLLFVKFLTHCQSHWQLNNQRLLANLPSCQSACIFPWVFHKRFYAVYRIDRPRSNANRTRGPEPNTNTQYFIYRDTHNTGSSIQVC